MSKRKVKDEFDDDFDVLGASTSAAGSFKAAPAGGAPRQPAAGPSKAKKARKAPAEKRLARERKTCSKNISDRVYRVQTQRFFLVDRVRVSNELREEFKVLGSTGNVYTVGIQQLPSCDCPDAQKGNHCKHILFVFLKVLATNPHTSRLYYQKALLTSELEDLFAHAPPSPQSVVSARLTKMYKVARGEDDEDSLNDVKSEADEALDGKRRLPQAGDSCPVCYEDFEEGQTAGLTFCIESCGGPLHSQCFGQWAATCGGNVTCVYCRAPWPKSANIAASGGGGPATVSAEGYTNLAGAAGISSHRDTSTYYTGPRRGVRGFDTESYYARRYGNSSAGRYDGYY